MPQVFILPAQFRHKHDVVAIPGTSNLQSASNREVKHLAVLIAIAACALAADDPFLGNWKCNFQKSKTTVANPPPQPVSMTLRYEAEGDGFRITAEAVTADGEKHRTE